MKHTVVELAILVVIILVLAAVIQQVTTFQEVEVIDGCEYIVSPGAYGFSTKTHKGNCTNEIHRNN